jgi:ankyrin repeat protein
MSKTRKKLSVQCSHEIELGNKSYAIGIIEQYQNDPRAMNAVDKNGRTILHLAAREGHKEIVRLFTHCPNVNVNAVDKNGDTPLHLAALMAWPHIEKRWNISGIRIGLIGKSWF